MQFEDLNKKDTNPKHAKSKKKHGGQKFYVALVLCLAAVAALTFVIAGGGQDTAQKPGASVEDLQAQQIPGGGLEQQASASPQATAAPKTQQASTPAKLAVPVKGEILKSFSQDELLYSKTLKEWTVHMGLDIAATQGSDVKAAMAGTVEFVGEDPEKGLMVTLAHEDNSRTIYANLASTGEDLKVGSKVEKGGVIGTVGTSAPMECEDVAHLHFEYLVGGKQVDPAKYIEGLTSTTAQPAQSATPSATSASSASPATATPSTSATPSASATPKAS